MPPDRVLGSAASGAMLPGAFRANSKTVTSALMRTLFTASIFVASLWFCQNAAAGPTPLIEPEYDADEGVYVPGNPNPVNFGTLATTNVPGFAGCGCGPVATVNSFVYLENTYPKVYGTKLTGALSQQNLINTAETLGTYMNLIKTGPDKGTNIANLVSGKYNYINKVAPGTTTVGGEISPTFYPAGGTPTGPAFSNVSFVQPTPLYLYNELKAGEDVELLITAYNPAGTAIFGHLVTAYAIDYAPSTGDGSIQFINSRNGSFQTRSFSETDGALTLISTIDTTNKFVVTGIVTESPIPEPGSIMLLVGGLGALVSFRVRKFIGICRKVLPRRVGPGRCSLAT